MTRKESKPTDTLRTSPKVGIDLKTAGEAGLVHVVGMVDEHFVGFGAIGPTIKSLVIDVSGMTRMTSFGVRQWLKAIDALPKSVTDVYLLGCPTFFVDQLNMVLNFGGAARVLTVVAPYTCPSCGAESGETVDVLAERSTLAKGGVPEKDCSRCSGKLEFDETPESYFSFVTKYAASNLNPGAAQLLASLGLYTAVVDTAGEKPPRIIKLVHGSVTYFRISGTVGAMFRARPFLVGAEGEVVIDLAEVTRFDPLGKREWTRLLKTLAGQVPSITLVDVTDSFLANAADSISLARNIAASSVLVPYFCIDCGKVASTSQSLEKASWPLQMPERVCSVCGGTTQSALRPETLAPLQKASTNIAAASSKVIADREELLSRAFTDENVARRGDDKATLTTEDTILGKYKIVRRLSSGGMAEVFLAKHVGIGGFERPVALKRILKQLLESRHLAVDMYLNEAKIAGRLLHPNIVQVVDVGEEAGALYLAMEYVKGKDLRDILKKLRANRTTMPLGDVCFIVREVAQALHHAFWSTDLAGKQLSVVHRDVSPHNVILGYDGTVKLLDFGVAMSAVTEHSETMIAGKWAYMSPEHTANQTVDHRSDLFSLGVMFYLLCTGTMPFGGTEPREIVKKIRAGNYKPLHEAAPHIPEPVAHLVSRMLASKPEDRPQTGAEVAATLMEITRGFGLESSAVSIITLLSQLFGNEEGATTPVAELLRNSSSDISATRRTAQGTGPTPTSMEASPSPTPSSFNRHTPSTGMPIDHSVSLTRKSADLSSPVNVPKSSEFQNASPIMPEAKLRSTGGHMPMPHIAGPNQQSGRVLRVFLIAVMVIAVAVAMYVFVKPQ
jgi:eukaryotic-like serine/threonine-protein kinase